MLGLSCAFGIINFRVWKVSIDFSSLDEIIPFQTFLNYETQAPRRNVALKFLKDKNIVSRAK